MKPSVSRFIRQATPEIGKKKEKLGKTYVNEGLGFDPAQWPEGSAPRGVLKTVKVPLPVEGDEPLFDRLVG